MSQRSMVKILLADNFYSQEDATKYANVVRGLNFRPMDYGHEIENFNLIFPDLEPVLSKVIGEKVIIDKERSGTFRRPLNCVVRFEDFSNFNEWCFVIALEKTTFNMYTHIKDGIGDLGTIDARSVLDVLDDHTKLNYMNLLEWNIDINIKLDPSQGVFFRPWMFHSFEDGIVQYFRLIGGQTE